MRDQALDFERDGGESGRWLPAYLATALLYAAVLVLVLLIAWFVYSQLTAVRGVAVDAASPRAITMLPPPPPLPPPPEEIKPPEPQQPTEQPNPAPVNEPAPAEALEAAAPMTMNAPAQPGPSPYGIASGSGGGAGAPGSKGTCFTPPCGPAGGGAGMSLAMYENYLSSELQRRVQRDERANRGAYSAEFLVWVSAGGAITSVQIARSSGSTARDRALVAAIGQVSDLRTPPGQMSFPRKITVRGRSAL